MKLTTRLKLALRLRKSGATSLLPLLTFMVWTGTILLLFYHMVECLVLYITVHYCALLPGVQIRKEQMAEVLHFSLLKHFPSNFHAN